jgi:hypothetical protein
MRRSEPESLDQEPIGKIVGRRKTMPDVASAMSKNTIRNHFSPRFTNEPWADKNGLIVKFSRRADGTLIKGRTGPREWGAENYLYSQDLEDALSYFERLVKPLYENF